MIHTHRHSLLVAVALLFATTGLLSTSPSPLVPSSLVVADTEVRKAQSHRYVQIDKENDGDVGDDWDATKAADDDGAGDDDADNAIASPPSLVSRLFSTLTGSQAKRSFSPTDKSRFPRPLSHIAAKIYKAVTEVASKYPHYSPTPVELIGASATFSNHVVANDSSTEFVDSVYYPYIVGAKEEVLMSTMSFDYTTHTAKGVADAIVELNRLVGLRRAKNPRAKRVRVFLVTDTLAATFFQHQTPHLLAIGRSHATIPASHHRVLPHEGDVPHLDFRTRVFHKSILGALHSKMLLIDGQMAVLGSKNVEVNHALENMYTLQGSVVRGLRSDFQRIWGKNSPLPPLSSKHAMPTGPRKGEVPVLIVSNRERRSGLAAMVGLHANSSPQNTAWLEAFRHAKKSVFVQSPNIGAKPFVDAIVAAARRGVKVTVITPFKHGDMSQKISPGSYGSNQDAVKRIYKKLGRRAKSAMRVCWFRRLEATEDDDFAEWEWSHVKNLIVDDQIVMMGSGNQDAQSYYHSREVNMLIDDAKVAKRVKNNLLAEQRSIELCSHDY